MGSTDELLSRADEETESLQSGGEHDPTDVYSYNRFLYARGNPLKYTDPSGHIPEYADDTGGDDIQWTLWDELK